MGIGKKKGQDLKLSALRIAGLMAPQPSHSHPSLATPTDTESGCCQERPMSGLPTPYHPHFYITQVQLRQT